MTTLIKGIIHKIRRDRVVEALIILTITYLLSSALLNNINVDVRSHEIGGEWYLTGVNCVITKKVSAYKCSKVPIVHLNNHYLFLFRHCYSPNCYIHEVEIFRNNFGHFRPSTSGSSYTSRVNF